MTKINFTGDFEELKAGLEHIKAVLDFEISADGIEVYIKKAEELYVKYDCKKGEISYVTKASFFRMLTLFLKNIGGNAPFEINEKIQFKTCGVMLDVARNGVMTVKSIKEFLNYMAAMGLNELSLYLEDVFEVKERPYFGYLRGRYTFEEFKEIDDYAYDLGIDAYPHIEALGHMEQYLKYWEATDVKDTSSVLLAESEKTYEFLELLIDTVTKPFRSKKIGLTMDEAHDLGLGNYLKKFGYKDKADILLNHLNKVAEIAKKRDLIMTCAGDMFFRLASKTYSYYDKSIEFTQELIDKVPENVRLALWYYRGENPDGLVESLFENQVKLCKNSIYEGSCWNFRGFLCDQKFGLENAKICLPMAKKYNIDWVDCNMFGDDGTECDAFYILPNVFAYGEHMYNQEVSDEQIKDMFEFVTKADFDAFVRMSDFHADFESLDDEEKVSLYFRYFGKALFWQDVLFGVKDEYLYSHPMDKYYKDLADDMKKHGGKDDKWNDYYRFAENLCDTLSLKCEIAQNLQKAYLNGDKDYLKDVVANKFLLLKEKVSCVHSLHKKMWHNTYKPFGFECIDVRYGGMIARINTAIERIDSYLKGEVANLEELEATRLRHEVDGTNRYYGIYTASSIR